MRRKIFFAAITVFMFLFTCAFAACGDDGVQPGTVDSLPDFDGEKTDMSVSQVKDVLTDMISAGGAIPGILQGGSGTVSKEEALAQLDEALEMFENVTAFKAAAVSDEVYENYKKKCEESGLRYAGEYNVDGVLYTSYMGRNSMAFVIRSGTDMTAAIFVMPEEEIIEYDMPSAEVWDRYGLGGMTQPEGSRITFVAESSVDKTFDINFEFDNTTKKVYDDAVVTLSHTDEGSVTPPADAVDEGKLLPSTQWKDSHIAFDVIPSPSGFDDFIAFFDNESTVRLVFLSGEEDSIQWQPGDGLELQYGSNYVADVGGAKVYVYMGTGSGYGYYDNEKGQYVTDPRYYMSFHISVER